MPKLIFDVPYSQAGQNLNNPAPTVTRYTVATLPLGSTAMRGVVVLVTDSTTTPGTVASPNGVGVAPVGGGTNLQAVWWNGQAWIGV